MVAKTLRILFLFLFPSLVLGQSIELSVSPAISDNNPSTFTLQGDEVTITESNIRFATSGNSITSYKAVGISPDETLLSILKRESGKSKMTVYNTKGQTLMSYSGSQIGAEDPSLSIYPFNNGNLILRENITHFTFYDTLGDIFKTVSNSSGSEQGETISKVVMNPSGQTVVLYNPKIKRGSQLGSKAQVMTAAKDFSNILYSKDRYIKNITVSADGNMIIAITAKSGTEDQVQIMDKFGNNLNTITTNESLTDASLSADLEYVILYSERRVMVYSTLDGDSQGATSFRSPVFLADYFPKDNVLLALTGSYSEGSGIIRNASFRAINLEQRSITSKEFSSSLGFSKALTPRFVRTAKGTYRLEGASKQIEIETSF